jgi:hypothetical protein
MGVNEQNIPKVSSFFFSDGSIKVALCKKKKEKSSGMHHNSFLI